MENNNKKEKLEQLRPAFNESC